MGGGGEISGYLKIESTNKFLQCKIDRLLQVLFWTLKLQKVQKRKVIESCLFLQNKRRQEQLEAIKENSLGVSPFISSHYLNAPKMYDILLKWVGKPPICFYKKKMSNYPVTLKSYIELCNVNSLYTTGARCAAIIWQNSFATFQTVNLNTFRVIALNEMCFFSRPLEGFEAAFISF